LLAASVLNEALPEAESTSSARVQITSLPDYATSGLLRGRVRGIDNPGDYRIAPYIQIEGGGWWTKPTFASPTVAIAADGSFAANVVSGGLDSRATIYCAALIPAGTSPPRADGDGRIPESLNPLAIDCEQRFGRTIEFAGYTWGVKDAPLPVGPGSNRFSSHSQDVFADEDGLHLTIRYRDGAWRATEVVLLESHGYATYAYQTSSELDELDANAVFGAFLWDPYGDEATGTSPHREIDFEDSRWGDANAPENTQMVVQPWYVAGNRHRYQLPDLSGDADLTRLLTWQEDEIVFTAVRGEYSPTNFPESAVIEEWVYGPGVDARHFVPESGREAFRFNLWLTGASAPAEGQTVEVVISDFSVHEPVTPPELSIVPADTSITENGSTTAVISRTWRRGEVQVALAASDTTEIDAPLVVALVDGQSTSQPFVLRGKQDGEPDGDQTVTLYATAAGYVRGETSIAITDAPRPRWQNPVDRFDVNAVDGPTPLDALLVVNYLNIRHGEATLPELPHEPPPYYDVNGDGWCTPADILVLINRLNAGTFVAGEGEHTNPLAFYSPEPAWDRVSLPWATSEATPPPDVFRQAGAGWSGGVYNRSVSNQRSDKMRAVLTTGDSPREVEAGGVVPSYNGEMNLEEVLDEFARDIDEQWCPHGC
jgi:hypothetical protein